MAGPTSEKIPVRPRASGENGVEKGFDDPEQIRIAHSNGAIYLLRTVQQHHVNLSNMADTKANILVGVSAVIFTMLVGQMKTGGLTLPVGILSVSTLLAAISAIIAVMPSAKGPAPGTREFNPLFFGSFGALTREQYCREMEKVLRDDPGVYTAMALDIYGIGSVLYRKKYRFLSYGYRIFLAGLILAFFTVLPGWLK